MLNSLEIKNHFNKAASTYDANCYIQTLVGTNLINRLRAYKATAQNIIDLGCGTGLLTEMLAERYSNFEQFFAIDIADSFLEKARERLYKFNIEILEKSFESFYYPKIVFDLVVANLSLHWSSNLELTLHNIYNNLSNEGVLAFSLPLDGTFKELGTDRILPFFKQHDIQLMLARTSYKILSADLYVKSIVFPSFILALKSIKQVGANYYGIRKHNSNLLYFKKQAKLPFRLTYNIGIFIVTKEGSNDL
ncbi:methyltransferase domain-containing protein [Rickettsiales endosymbiont of Stachyamoeba lipophora]|uniref:methyltransferase domain-containing protein n=1 Tax=Rickettsiales endosymbiont of Stachyamoeba lipophora TaxID=2486578 RepID=UPI000F64F937|nr:methyltransferase domain-containing protein [Rickettsiales endosymbiont of Stachyamoeba lipophora]AZL16078.1 methyltransferase domain-containing protein [Rickettsiales endosymbiont of Stachyamoeba lipophora]